MKRYRLIKKYPGSPNIGEIATFRQETEDYVINNPYHQSLPKSWIENYPEFWEKIDEQPFIVYGDGLEVTYEGDNIFRIRQIST